MLSSRIEIPLCKYTGFAQVSGDRDYANALEVVSPTSAKLPYIEKFPTYTTWIFLDKNQRMAEYQSVVERRRIYYDQHGSEALICSDSEEDIAESEEDKHEFSEGEERILWTVRQEYGLGEEILRAVSQFIGVTISEIQIVRNGMARSQTNTVTKTLKIRRILDLKRLRAVKGMPEGSGGNALHRVMTTTLEEKDQAASSDAKGPKTNVGADLMQDERGITEEARPVTLEGIHDSEGAGEAQNLEISCIAIDNHESSGKLKASQERYRPLDDSVLYSDGSQDSAIKKQKTVLVLDLGTKSSEAIPSQDHASSESTKSRNHHVGTPNENEAQITAKNNQNESDERVSVTFACSASASSDKTEDNLSDGATDVAKVPELKWSSSDWKPIERELYLKGVEIFGRNR
ncbi:histone-lysine N-methyltransferase EZA1-like isoform X2 [Durio zibethinus]|uniref:Histone-lysine N-methyltransferase EZA1-like isoform X2 n=1 Tax=Durio zibethinus TaxID=66656 RepID=A0A6P5ZZJ2_DURZI|nr:histone-lysine N-methyltransferase EZA1-like isoform X2 [Durio zibethinus]